MSVECICVANGFPRCNWKRDSNELINYHRVKLIIFKVLLAICSTIKDWQILINVMKKVIKYELSM